MSGWQIAGGCVRFHSCSRNIIENPYTAIRHKRTVCAIRPHNLQNIPFEPLSILRCEALEVLDETAFAVSLRTSLHTILYYI